jgi:hypothetical protein
MNLKTKIATIAAASFFALSIGTSVLAQNTVDQAVTAGTTLTASFTSATLAPVVFSNAAQTNGGMLSLAVVDGRGNNAGWNVSVISTAFNPKEGDAPAIAATGFVYAPLRHGAIVANSGTTLGVTNVGATGSLGVTHVPLRAAILFGTGNYTAPLAVDLAIPAQQPVGVYQATLTVTIATGP